MGIKAPPIYGENVNAYTKEAKKAIDAFKEAYDTEHTEKALSALEYAEKCMADLRTVIAKDE
jgi:hypothetical protein